MWFHGHGGSYPLFSAYISNAPAEIRDETFAPLLSSSRPDLDN